VLRLQQLGKRITFERQKATQPARCFAMPPYIYRLTISMLRAPAMDLLDGSEFTGHNTNGYWHVATHTPTTLEYSTILCGNRKPNRNASSVCKMKAFLLARNGRSAEATILPAESVLLGRSFLLAQGGFFESMFGRTTQRPCCSQKQKVHAKSQ
jgi:hypothetical protein